MKQEIDWKQELCGRGCAKLDLERDRRKSPDVWRGLECMSSGEGLMADWEWAFGSAVGSVVPLLGLTEKQSDSFPCPARPVCECRHEIQETDFGLVAMCMCGSAECESVVVEPKDIVVRRFDVTRFGGYLRQAVGFSEPDGSAYVSLGVQEIGRYASVAAPVYFSLARSNLLLRELQKLLGLRDGPFLLLTPTGSGWSPDVEALARAHGGGHIALSSVLNVQEDGALVSNGAIMPMLDEFARRLGRGNGLGTMVQRIDTNLAAIARGAAELRRENEELKQMQGAGLFKFALRVDVEDFQAFATVMALGNRKAAAEFLDVPLRTFYHRVDGWQARGKDYQRMFRLVEWRKATGRKIQVRLEDSILSSEAEGAENPETIASVLGKMRGDASDSYPEIIRQVLQALREQNANNWEGVREELVEILGEEVLQ